MKKLYAFMELTCSLQHFEKRHWTLPRVSRIQSTSSTTFYVSLKSILVFSPICFQFFKFHSSFQLLRLKSCQLFSCMLHVPSYVFVLVNRYLIPAVSTARRSFLSPCTSLNLMVPQWHTSQDTSGRSLANNSRLRHPHTLLASLAFK